MEIIYTILVLLLWGWSHISYVSKNTYFRPLFYYIEERSPDSFEAKGKNTKIEAEELKEFLKIAVCCGRRMSADIYFPVVGISVLSLAMVWGSVLVKKNKIN